MDGAAWATYFVSEWQSEHGVLGDVAEIGVHHGKYLLILSMLSQDNEKTIAIDVFGNQELNVDRSGKGDYAKFMANFAQFDGREHKLVVHNRDSLTLGGRNLSVTGCPHVVTAPRSIRLFSVDGSHTAHHTRNDIIVAFDSLCPKGIVVVDDFYNAHWPGVQEGVHSLLAERPDIRAVAFGENKLFLTKSEDHDAYLKLFKYSMSEFYKDIKLCEIHGHSAISFTMADPRSMFTSDMKRKMWIGTFGQSGNSIVELLEGWSTPEVTGVWMTRREATARVTVPNGLQQKGGPATLELALTPFIHRHRKTRRIEIENSLGDHYKNVATGGITVHFEIEDAAKVQTIELKFIGDEPDIPHNVLDNHNDKRPLSVFAGTVKFKTASNV